MNIDNGHNSVTLPANYSGACKAESLTNESLLKFANPQSYFIHGPSLFALNYRVLPCTATESVQESPGDHNEIYTYNMFGQFASCARGQQWSGKQKQGGMYHATSTLQFLINEYKADPDTFIYDWAYDTFDKISVMSTIYIDLTNYISGKKQLIDHGIIF
ncbi:unnamed protein product [Rotaria magnacalcarata]|uniref:Uncharacterized protein n=2 Tax=Rotaria magnacalcarata TaxID=392030 RepID=A0A820Q9H5_9BILA|nr:unnamed protein product [Rotaria magnacalcarata]CAF4415875.1 unnamed protein product [Rotaria magnacalcarata]